MELLETSSLQLSGKQSRAPSLMQSEKISEQLRVVAERVPPVCVCGSGMLLLSKGRAG